jgi:hypothetical protein
VLQQQQLLRRHLAASWSISRSGVHILLALGLGEVLALLGGHAHAVQVTASLPSRCAEQHTKSAVNAHTGDARWVRVLWAQGCD